MSRAAEQLGVSQPRVSTALGHAAITLAEPPLPLPKFDLKQHWHRKFHHDPRITLLRGVLATLFNDELDEWPKQPKRPARPEQSRREDKRR